MRKIVVMRVVVAMVLGAILSTHAVAGEDTDKLADQLKELEKQVKALRKQVPGLGDRMTVIQLHMSKLYFAAEALNWELAAYELHELEEAIESAMRLNEVKNGVNISAVLEALQNTQINELKQSIQERNLDQFTSSYNRTVISCNACHQAAGYGFIKIIKPSAPPVTNQDWVPSTSLAMKSDTTKAG